MTQSPWNSARLKVSISQRYWHSKSQPLQWTYLSLELHQDFTSTNWKLTKLWT